MSKLSSTSHARVALQFCAAGALAALMSGCSSDATRFGDPFSNPFSTASFDQAPRRQVASASDVIPAGRTPPVTSQALAPRGPSYAMATPVRPAPTVAFREPISHETTGSIDPGAVRTASNVSFGGWSSSGGTPVQVADGESADILSKRYGVPTNVLLQVNGLHTVSEVRPGSRVTIPVYGASGQSTASTRIASAPRVAEPVQRVAEATPRTVEPHLTLPAQHDAHGRLLAARPATLQAKGSLAPVARQVASTTAHQKHVADKETVAAPHGRTGGPEKTVKTAAIKAAPLQPVPAKTSSIKTAALPATKGQKVAMAEPTKAAAPDPAPTTSVAAAAPATAAAGDANPEFRWPAHGRIIQSFKGGSGGNDGINIAVPEGTSVKAAEGGVVAYAGSELKGYGNLVLIRHPNGFVSAYANNGELDVKRGDSVKRGQVIAKSGQSGNVSSPQLHFELRKGSTPVDPTQFLAGL